MKLLKKILSHAWKRARAVAIIDDHGTTTYLKLALGAMYFSRQIERWTQRPRIGLMLPTGAAAPMCIMGAWMAKRIPVPMNFMLSKEELAYIIQDAELDTILTVKPLIDHLGGPTILPDEVKVVYLDELTPPKWPTLRWPPEHNDDEVAAILYTSGTSGRPKGVLLTHGNFVANLLGCIEHANLQRVDTFLGVLPQFHCFGLTALTLAPLALGAKVVYTARFVPKRLVELFRKHRPQIFMAVPSMYKALLGVKDANRTDFVSLRFPVSGGEPLQEATLKEWQERFGVMLLEGYGLTETSPVISWCSPTHNRPGSVGRPLPGVRVLILDDKNIPLGPDADGEIVVSGPTVMAGYFKLPELTQEVMVEVFAAESTGPQRRMYFRTGDIGRLDRDGFLYITGRKKEMMIVAGENVFPREIEEVIQKHPALKDVGVIGRPDESRGEVPVAFVELKPGMTVNPGELRTFCRQKLAGYKVPRDVFTVPHLPLSPTGKVQRRLLAQGYDNYVAQAQAYEKELAAATHNPPAH
jgi:long-chain acyl-CoA synthetase